MNKLRRTNFSSDKDKEKACKRKEFVKYFKIYLTCTYPG